MFNITGLSCAATPGDRIVRAVVGIVVGAFALSSVDNLWFMIPSGLFAAVLLGGAIMGSRRLLPKRLRSHPVIPGNSEVSR